MIYKCGYKYLNAITSTASQINKIKKFKEFLVSEVSMTFDRFKFKDEVTMEYYYQNLRDKYRYDEEMIDKLKPNLKLVGVKMKINPPDIARGMGLFLNGTKSILVEMKHENHEKIQIRYWFLNQNHFKFQLVLNRWF